MPRTISALVLLSLLVSQAHAAIGEWYLKGKIEKINKNSVILMVDKTKVAVPKNFIKESDLKVGKEITRSINEQDLVKMASIKSGGGSK